MRNSKYSIFLIALVTLIVASSCSAGSSTQAVTTAKPITTVPTTTVTTTATTSATTTKAATTTATATVSTTAATTAAPPLKKGGEAFQKLLASAIPVFSDKFENKTHSPETITSAFYKQTVTSTRNVTYTSGVEGGGVHLDNYDSYVGYPAGIVKASEGSIRFAYKPDAKIYSSYNERQSVWKDYGSIAPPYTAFLIDTVGWNAAFKGGYSAYLTFKKGDGTFSYLSFGTWSGSNWSYTAAELTPTINWDSNKWYDIVIAYSKNKGKTAVYIDGYLAGEAKYNTDMSQTEGFFLGQGPWKSSMEYWPYGPHTLKGTYSLLRIYDMALMD